MAWAGARPDRETPATTIRVPARKSATDGGRDRIEVSSWVLFAQRAVEPACFGVPAEKPVRVEAVDKRNHCGHWVQSIAMPSTALP